MKKNIVLFIISFLLIFIVAGVYIYNNHKQYNAIEGISNLESTYLAFYTVDENTTLPTMPGPGDGYTLDKENSYCEVNGARSNDMSIDLTPDWKIQIHGLTNSRTRCNLYFKKGPINLSPFPQEVLDKVDIPDGAGNGLFTVTSDLDGWTEPELRYGGVNYVNDNKPYVHNYVTFNNELWRIIGLVNVKTASGIEQRLKLIRDAKLTSNKTWNGNSKNDWTKASLMTYLNGDYYNGTGSPSLTDTVSKNMIATDIIWSLGGVGSEYTSLKANEFYKKERGTPGSGAAPDATEWPMKNAEGTYETGKALVGLMYPSDYGYAVGGGKAKRNNCLKSIELYNYNGDCSNNNWLFLGADEWLLTMDSSGSYDAFYVLSSGYIISNSVDDSSAVRPVVYLSSKVQIIGGTGEHGNPYELFGWK